MWPRWRRFAFNHSSPNLNPRDENEMQFSSAFSAFLIGVILGAAL